MKLVINDSKTIKQVQDEFSSMFPYLKIEFFTKPHEARAGSKKQLLVGSNLSIGDIRKSHENGELYIVPHMTVTSLEQNFQMIFGLSVQVFRRSGKVWLETINTDYWTLAQHNELGEYTVKGNQQVEHE
jgi:hypothetical protein